MKTCRIFKLIIYSSVVCLLSGTTINKNIFPKEIDPSHPDLLPIIDTIQSWITGDIVPSMAVAVAQRDEILWLKAYGVVDKVAKSAASIHTSYALGSLSKSISATGVMTLVERGIIDLDQPVNPLLGKVPLRSYRWDTDSVQIWHILNSSAGLPHGWTTYDDSTFFNPDETRKMKSSSGII